MLPQNISGIFKVMSLDFVESELKFETHHRVGLGGQTISTAAIRKRKSKQKRRAGAGIVKGIPTPVSEGTQTFCKGNTGAPVHKSWLAHSKPNQAQRPHEYPMHPLLS